MLFTGLSLSYLDQCALAVMDILHGDAWLRDNFGGRELGGTASITPATTTLAGTSTGWSTDADDSLSPGIRLMLGSQLTTVDSVTSDTALELVTAHVNGLSSATIDKAARIFRTDRPAVPVNVAMPFITVSVGTLPSFDSAVGRFSVRPAVTVTFIYEANLHPLDDASASWAGLAQHVLALFASVNANQRLCVDRFGGEALAYKLLTGTPGDAIVQTAERSFVTAPAIELTFEGMDPIERAALTQEW